MPSCPLPRFPFKLTHKLSGDDNGLKSNITTSLIINAIQTLHSESIQKIFHHSQQPLPSFPHHNNNSRHGKTAFHQLGAIFEDEGTVSGTYKVHDDIFLRQMDHDKHSSFFQDRLMLVHGDQLTSQLIRTVQKEQIGASTPYDRRQWMMGVPAWFHIEMNLLNTILRTHLKSDSVHSTTRHCLSHDMKAWDRGSETDNVAKFHILEPIIGQSFASRVLALFYAVLRRRGHLGRDVILSNPRTVDDIVSHLCPSEFLEVVQEIQNSAFTLEAWNGDATPDREYTNMCRFLQEMELFLAVRSALKYGDTHILRSLVDQLILVFWGAGQHNYGREMLYYRWLLSPVNDDTLQEAVLSSGIVNWQGKQHSYKPIDLSLEHLNGHCKIDMKMYKNSTHDINTTFDRVCLTNTWMRETRAQLEGAFGSYMSGTHTTAKATREIFYLAADLFTSGLAEARSVSSLSLISQRNQYLAPNILDQGAEVLEAKLDDFNSTHVASMCKYRPQRPVYESDAGLDNFSSPSEDEEATTTVLEMEPYAPDIDERYDSHFENLIINALDFVDDGEDTYSVTPMED